MGSGASIEELTSELEQDFNRVVPRTPRGSIDVASCDRGKVRAVVDLANSRISAKYKLAWDGYALSDGAETPVVGALRDACAALIRDFDDKAPRCALPTDADAAELIEMASDHGPALHKALRGPITNSGGAYLCGPQKKVDRITEKARADYNDDVARVVDVERATGVYDSLTELNHALTLLREAADGGSLTIRRCKDGFFSNVLDSGYRDLKFNVEVSGFVGELQLNLRQILQVKDHAHKVYDVDRAVDDGSDDALRNAIVHLDLESEQVLRLALTGDQSAFGTRSSVSVLGSALAKALPSGCELANIYKTGDAVHSHVRLGVVNIAALATLRDAILFEDSFERAINLAVAHDLNVVVEATDQELEANGFIAVDMGGREIYIHRESEQVFVERPKRLSSYKWIRVDRAAFLECYARIMMHFTRLTPHQRNQLEALRDATVAVLLAPAGGGKTFVAVQRVLHVLNSDPNAVVLFTARTDALALFACKWLVIASRKSADRIVSRIHVLVAPFARGPRSVRVEATDGRQKLVFDETRAEVTKYALTVVDEAHHLVDDTSLRSELAELGAAEASLLFLGDASQATAAMRRPEDIARSLVDIPWRPLECFDPTLTDDDYLEIKVIDNPDELQRLCERPAPGAVEAVGWDEDKAEMCGGDGYIYEVRENTCSYEIEGCDIPFDAVLVQKVLVATLSEVVRSTQRIVAGAAAFQLEAGRKAETSTHTASTGPPLVARIFTTSGGDDAGETYAREVVEAIAAIRRQLVDLEDLDDRVAVVGPDDAFVEWLREPLARGLDGSFELVDAAMASAALPRGETEARDGSKAWLVVDSVENMDGLERLVVICVGLDQVIDRGDGVSETRSLLYRAMTRAQLAVAVVNEALPGGWLEFLGRVELSTDEAFDDAAERRKQAETAADDVVRFSSYANDEDESYGAGDESTEVSESGSGAAVEDASVEEEPADAVADQVGDGAAVVGTPAAASIDVLDVPTERSTLDAIDAADAAVADAGARPAPVAEKAAADADVATTPSEAEPIKVLQSIWDASAVATASRGDLRFMPFFEDGDLRARMTLRGHSGEVRCGVRCTFVMMCLRRRSGALRCFRTGGASCLRRKTRRSRCGTWRPANAWRRWKGTRTKCAAASTVLL